MHAFDRIYRRNLWNGVESRSGPGSGASATSRLTEELLQLVAELHIASALDIGCGDGFWMPDLPGYVGIDVSPWAIRGAQARHPARDYRVADARKGGLERYDLVISRDAMQHLPLRDGLAILQAIHDSGSTWLLASTYLGGTNVDVEPGGFYCPDLTTHPFNLGTPERTIFDGYAYDWSSTIRDPSKVLGLWSVG